MGLFFYSIKVPYFIGGMLKSLLKPCSR
ncbi:stage V sporulation protein M [Peribacillus frigoritolerans]